MQGPAPRKETHPGEFIWPDATIKGSERFNDLLKIEHDRLAAKVKAAEERARANSTSVLAAIGVVTLIRTLQPDIPVVLIVIFAFVALFILALAVAISFNRTVLGISPKWMRQEHERLWHEDRSYLEIMQLYQNGMMDNIDVLDRLQEKKYKQLDWQNGLLAVAVVLLVCMLIVGALGLH